jgi:hypothetical protein
MAFAAKLNTQGCFEALSTKLLNGKKMIEDNWVRILLLRLLLVSLSPFPLLLVVSQAFLFQYLIM